MPTYRLITSFLFSTIGQLTVPFFFLISGYFFFLRMDFNAITYIRKMRSRLHTLLIPYLFWNWGWMIFYLVASRLPLLSKNPETVIDYSLLDFLKGIWVYGYPNDNVSPFDLPLWFLRNLILIASCSPLVYWLIKYTRLYGVLFLGLVWYGRFYLFGTDLWWRYMMNTVFFFSLGAYFSIHGMNMLSEIRRLRVISFILYPLIALLSFMTYDVSYNMVYIEPLRRLVGLLFFFNLIAWLFERRKIRLRPFLVSVSFFLYASHIFVESLGRELMNRVFLPKTDIEATVIFFILPSVATVFILTLYYLLRRLMPRLTAIITGGRI
jgi:fucose 4-O-acetylase-like acetyltransferase